MKTAVLIYKWYSTADEPLYNLAHREGKKHRMYCSITRIKHIKLRNGLLVRKGGIVLTTVASILLIQYPPKIIFELCCYLLKQFNHYFFFKVISIE